MIYFFLSLLLFLGGAFLFFRLDVDLWSALCIRFGPSPHQIFSGKRVWIIGASSGIGAQLAYDLAVKYGAKVALSARRENELKNVADKCVATKKSIDTPIVIPYDIRGSVDYHKQIAEKVIAALGRIDYLILNSGQTQRAIAEETDIEVTKGMIDINVVGLLSALKAVLPHFISRRSGHILVTSSVAGRISSSLISSYSLTKFALQGYFESLRVELFHKNISVTLALPGPVDTPIMSAAWGAKTGDQGEAARANDSAERKMSCERCADLMLKGTAVGLDEIWCTTQPTLFFMYLYQYLPTVARFINKRMGTKRIEAYKNNSDPNFAFSSVASFIGKGGKKTIIHIVC